ncbi:MAG: hypothetical protein LBT47_04250, partial [Deltaproteobacteria bacterium]|nr:hypothetical protein [Deltaproteobacteria bacterium]
SVHNWFGPDRPKVYCIAMIDDASSRLFAGFYEADSTLTNKDLIKRYINQYGCPLVLYTDKASHFIDNLHFVVKSPPGHAESPVETQIQRTGSRGAN